MIERIGALRLRLSLAALNVDLGIDKSGVILTVRIHSIIIISVAVAILVGFFRIHHISAISSYPVRLAVLTVALDHLVALVAPNTKIDSQDEQAHDSESRDSDPDRSESRTCSHDRPCCHL